MTSAGSSRAAPPASGGGAGAWLLVEADGPGGQAQAPLVAAVRGATVVANTAGPRLLAAVDAIPAEVDVVVLGDEALTSGHGPASVRVLLRDLDGETDAVVCVRPVTDALKRVVPGSSGPPRSVAAVPRDDLGHPAWPQVIRRQPLRAAVDAGADLRQIADWLVDAGYRVRLRPARGRP